jgi:type II secretory pathway predicted ATPase ExeA
MRTIAVCGIIGTGASLVVRLALAASASPL